MKRGKLFGLKMKNKFKELLKINFAIFITVNLLFFILAIADVNFLVAQLGFNVIVLVSLLE